MDSNLRGETSYAGIIEKTSFRELDKFISRSLKFQYQTSFEMTVFSVVFFSFHLTHAYQLREFRFIVFFIRNRFDRDHLKAYLNFIFLLGIWTEFV